MTWILIFSLCSGCSGKATSTIEMQTKEACVLAAQTLAARRAWTYCVDPRSGEVVIGRD